MKRYGLKPSLASGILCLLALLAGAAAQEVTVTHAQGETTVPVNPEVVFSYDYAAIDTLSALGVEVDGMPPLAGGGERYGGESTLNIGSLFEPDYEAVSAAEPDLIIVAGRSAEAYPELSRIAPTIDLSFSGEDFMGDLTRNTETLARIFDKQAEAQTRLEELGAQIETLRAQVAEGGDGLVIMTSGGSVSALAPQNERGGRGALLYGTLGLTPSVADVETATHGEPVSFEFLLESDPDRLFVIDRDAAVGAEEGQPAEEVLDNPLVRETTAWQEEGVTYLNSFDWYIITGAGLNSAQRMLDEIAAAYN